MKNKKVLILSIIAAIIIVAIVIGVLYFTTDLLKTEQQLFYKYITQTKVMDSNFINQYNIANERLTKNSSSSSESLDFSIALPNQETGIADIQKLFNVKSNGLKNTLLKQSYRDFTFSNNNQNFLTLKYIKDNNTYGIFADNILAKYLAVENSNLKDLFSKIGVEDTTFIPDSIPTDYEEILKIDEATLQHLSQTYAMLIYNNIDKTHFEKNKNTDNTETLSLLLSEQDIINVLKSILETAKNDTILLKLIVEKAGLLQYNQITVENIQTKIQELINKIGETSEYPVERNFIIISLIKKDSNIVRITFEVNYEENASIEYEDSTDNNDIATIAQEKIKKYTFEIDFSENNKLVLLMKENDNEINKAIINYFFDNNNIKMNMTLDYKIEEDTRSTKIQYEIINYQSDNIVENIVTDISISEEEKYQMSINKNTILKQDVQISKLTTENSAKLNNLTSEELNNLFVALINRIMVVYGTELNSLPINMNSENNF